MSKAIIFALAAVVVSTSAAFAYEDPENRLGDRYPILEPAYRSISPVMSRQVTRLGPYAEDPENRISDRYPALEEINYPSSGARFAARYAMPRQVVELDRFSDEDPENRIGDRYPLLERLAVAQAQVGRRITIRSVVTTGSVATNGSVTRRAAQRNGTRDRL